MVIQKSRSTEKKTEIMKKSKFLKEAGLKHNPDFNIEQFEYYNPQLVKIIYTAMDLVRKDLKKEIKRSKES
jgi:hypothetical protein